MTIDIDPTNIAQHVDAPGVALINWSSVNRRDSLFFDEAFAVVAAANPEARFGRVDTVRERPLAKEWAVSEAPSVMVFRDGILLFVHDGPLSVEALDRLVRSAQATDVQAARTRVNGHGAHGPARAGSEFPRDRGVVNGGSRRPPRKPV